MTLPLYRNASSSLPGRVAEGHAGLWFDKFCNTWEQRRDSWSMSGDGQRNSKLEWIRTLTRGAVGSKDQIEESALRMMRLVEGRDGTWAVFTAESRFVTGLGRSHPVENGFAWHPTLGAPYLPGSSIKGMVGAWAKEEGVTKEVADRLFGTSGQVGTACILDAIPIEPVGLEADVMTPHYAGWSEECPPGDWRSPTPIPFLVTAAGTSFLFGVMPRGGETKADMEMVEKWLREALEWAGAGAKTAVGYGRFSRNDEKRAGLKRQLSESVQRRNKQIRQEAEAREREERLASFSPVEREIQEMIDKRQDPGMPETTAIYMAVGDGRWSGDEKIEAARWLETKMKAKNQWKETTQFKNPSKDRDYNRTRQIIRWLNGE